MFRPQSRQPSDDDLKAVLPQAKRACLCVSARRQAQLESGWPGVFRGEILPMLWEAEADFADLYHPLFGAPNKPVAELLGILILKEFHDYTDLPAPRPARQAGEQALEAVQFNLQWQYALLPVRRTLACAQRASRQTGQLGFSQASICQKTLHNFRDRMVKSQKHQRFFHHLTGQIIDRFGLDTSRQRMDSTHVMSAMKQLTRLGLFVKTIEAFLFKLKRMAQKDQKVASLLAQLPRKFHQRYLEREGYFSDTPSSLASRRLDACAGDLWELIDQFRGDPKLFKLKQYRHLKRVFKDQCEGVPPQQETQAEPVKVHKGPKEAKAEVSAEASDVSSTADAADACSPWTKHTPVCSAGHRTGRSAQNDPQCDEAVRLKDPKNIAPTSLQSPSDPDATFLPVRCTLACAQRASRQTGGHKGKGYQFQLCETCVLGNPFEVITTTLLQGAHESDQNATVPLLETLQQQGDKPVVAFADSNYISGENIVQAEVMGVDLQGPLPGSKPASEAFTLSDFTFDLTNQQVLACPAGQAPLRHQDTRDQTGRSAYFDRTLCDVCPHASRCPTHLNQTQRRLTWTPEKLATARRQNQQQTVAFKEAYLPVRCTLACAQRASRQTGKIRSGIEATISHDKNDHGLGRLRVRGRPAVELASTFKTLAINVKRAVKYALKTMNEAAQTHLPPPHLSACVRQHAQAGVISARIFSRKPALWSLLKGFLKPLGSLQPILREWATNGAL